MIVSGSEKKETLQRCLNSINQYVDGVFITITSNDKNDLKPTAERYGAVVDVNTNFYDSLTKKEIKWLTSYLGEKPKITPKDKIFRFDKSRNHALSQVPKEFDWVLWMDVDDVFRGGHKLRELVKLADNNKIESIYVNYLYQVELGDRGEIKNVIIEHLRERLVKNNGTYIWVAPIHETLIEQKETKKCFVGDLIGGVCDVLHLSNSDRRLEALRRNVKNLEFSVCQTKGADPRPVYYLGKAYYDIGITDNNDGFIKKAKTLFESYIHGTKDHDYGNKSGWAEERAQCWEYLTEIYRMFGQHNNSIKASMNALIEDDKFPSIYINIAMSHLLKGEYERAIHWVKLASRVKTPNTTLVNNPQDQIDRSLEILYHANLNLNRLDEAWAAANKLAAMYPNKPDVVERAKFMDDLRLQRDLTKSFVHVANHLERTGSKDQLKLLVTAAPKEISDNPFLVDLANRVNPPRVWEKDEIAIWVGAAFTPWSGKTINKPGQSFIGGSEEAVIYVSEELTKLGWRVSVFCDPGVEEGEYNGVNYLPYYKFNFRDHYNILISWRQEGLVDSGVKADQIYIWHHDIINPLNYTEERLSKINKIMVLSPWHRSNISKVPDEKIMLTGNGIKGD